MGILRPHYMLIIIKTPNNIPNLESYRRRNQQYLYGNMLKPKVLFNECKKIDSKLIAGLITD